MNRTSRFRCYARLEQQRSPQPSEQMVAAITRALRLTLDERDHLFRLTGHHAPVRTRRSDHVAPALMRVLDRLYDTPAMVVSDLAETLAQNSMGVALLGDLSHHRGRARSQYYRWFTDPQERAYYPQREHEEQGRAQAAGLRAVMSLRACEPEVSGMVEELLQVSGEFRSLWQLHEVAVRDCSRKTFLHPEVDEVSLDCQVLHDQGQSLLVFTAVPGTPDDEKLQLLNVLPRGATVD